MKVRLESLLLSRIVVAAIAIQCSFVISCELITTVDRGSISRSAPIGGDASVGGGTLGSGGASASGPSSGGGINAETGGQASSSTNITGNGWETTSSGGSSNLADGCNGTWQGHVCGMNTIQVDGGIDVANPATRCDLSLESTPSVAQERLLVLIDCVPQPIVPVDTLDASVANGFSMDYKPIPAHLLFHGTSCDAMEAPGTHIVDVIVGLRLLRLVHSSSEPPRGATNPARAVLPTR